MVGARSRDYVLYVQFFSPPRVERAQTLFEFGAQCVEVVNVSFQIAANALLVGVCRFGGGCPSRQAVRLHFCGLFSRNECLGHRAIACVGRVNLVNRRAMPINHKKALLRPGKRRVDIRHLDRAALSMSATDNRG